MLALAQLVRAKLVTQTATLQTLYDVKPGENVAYQQRLAKFRAALTHLNVHGSAPAQPQTTTKPHRASAA